MFDNSGDQDATFAVIGSSVGSPLMRLLLSDSIEPGTTPGYQLCKLIYTTHPMGAVLAEAPSKRAQSKERMISIAVPGEQNLIRRYWDTWRTIGGYNGTTTIGATQIIHSLHTQSRIYGIASLGVGQRGVDTKDALDLSLKKDLYFNVFDPLNTAGSLVLNQDPNADDYQKPRQISVNGQAWHVSRTPIKMNEQPLYIEWSNSSFGFSGRSVYQRALFPLKSFVQTMITNDMVTKKAGLLIAKKESPGAFIDKIMLQMANWQRGKLKSGQVGQVMTIGVTEAIETLNMQNLDGAFGMARTNVIKDIATAVGMPASIIAQETLTEGFGEGTEDAKKEAAYLNDVRKELDPDYAFMDKIVQRTAWDEPFFESQKNLFPDYYGKMEYVEAIHLWSEKFEATWPNLIEEPDSEKAKNADVQFKAAIAMYQVMSPDLDPKNKATAIMWLAENANERKELFASQLDLDPTSLSEYLEDQQEQAEEMAEAAQEEGGDKEPKEPKPFAQAS